MTDLQALYAGICAHPDEDTPRLALADFLDEEGGKENAFRADFIRTHIKLTRAEPWSLEARETFPHWVKLQDAAMDRAREHKLPWVTHLKSRVHGWFFERGLVGELRLYAKRFVAEGASYFEQDPIRAIRFVTLRATNNPVTPQALFECPHLSRLAKLELDGSALKTADLAKLGASPHLTQLRSLALGGAQSFNSAAVPKLLESLTALNELAFRKNDEFGDTHLNALAKCKSLSRVTVLDLSGTLVGPDGLSTLAQSKHAAALTVLRLGEIGEYDHMEEGYVTRENTLEEGLELAEALAEAKSFGNLKELNLRSRALGDDGAKLLAGSAKVLPALRRLDLSGCQLTLEGVKALAKSELGQRLLYLGLAYSPELSEHKKKFAKMFPLAHV